jgi:hypothetical protein
LSSLTPWTCFKQGSPGAVALLLLLLPAALDLPLGFPLQNCKQLFKHGMLKSLGSSSHARLASCDLQVASIQRSSLEM